MSRPNTEGCTEWSCTYHGGDNRFKAGHADDCPIRSYTGFVMELIEVDRKDLPVHCTCVWDDVFPEADK